MKISQDTIFWIKIGHTFPILMVYAFALCIALVIVSFPIQWTLQMEYWDVLWRLRVDTMSVVDPQGTVCLTVADHMANVCSCNWWWQLLPVVPSLLLVMPETGTVEHTGLDSQQWLPRKLSFFCSTKHTWYRYCNILIQKLCLLIQHCIRCVLILSADSMLHWLAKMADICDW